MATSGICKPVFHWDSNKTHHSNTNEMYGKLLLLLGVMAAVFAEPHYPPPPPPHYPPPYPKPHVPVGPPHVTPHRPPHHVPHVPPHHVPHVPPHVPHVPPHTPHKPPHHVPHRHYIVPPYRYRRDVYDGVDAQELF